MEWNYIMIIKLFFEFLNYHQVFSHPGPGLCNVTKAKVTSCYES